MKSPSLIALVLLTACGVALADIPVKKPLQFYSKLWSPSPFTKPVVQTGPTSPDNPFKDYHLTGIAPIEGGYMVTISNKKDKTKKVVIAPGSESKFQIVKVERNPGVRLGTVVTLTDGNSQGEVRFEPDLVVLNTPAAQNPAEQQLPPGFNPNQQIQTGNNQVAPPTAPRSRIVPPANPGQNNNPNSGQNRGGNSQSRPPRSR